MRTQVLGAAVPTLSAIVVAGALAASVAETGGLHYTLSPVIEGGKLKAIDVEMALTGESDGETEIALPDNRGDSREAWRGVTQFRIEGATSVATGGNPVRRLVRHAPGAPLTVRYRLKQFWAGEPEGVEGRPIIKPGYFHFLGYGALARTKWSAATPASVSFKGFPKSWRLASDLEHGPLTQKTVQQSVTVGGDFRILKASLLRIALRGVWTFKDDDLLREIEPIIASHHKFWGDPPSAFLITMIPIAAKPNSASAGGTGLGDAFAFYVTPNMKLDRHIKHGLAHEHMHSWIPLRVGEQSPANDGLADTWLSEGFTDFYTYRLMARDGLSPIEEMAKALNEIMWTYAWSSARNATNATLGAEFWRDEAAHRIPYLRGLLIAAIADDRLRRESRGTRDLDEVMLEMRRVADTADVDAKPPLRENFLAATKAAGVDFAGMVKQFVDDAETVLLPADIWVPCGVVETSEVAEFARGFRGAQTKANKNIVVGVDPDGPAYAAGLRDGMKILNLDLSGERDSRVPLTYRVLVDGKVREISYLPQGKRRERVQELKLRMLDDAGRKACAARLGGLE